MAYARSPTGSPTSCASKAATSTTSSTRYPELRALSLQLDRSKIGHHSAVLDGEIVAFDKHGQPSFELLQQRMHVSSESLIRKLSAEAPVSYVIFDLLYLDGHTTIALPYRERRALLEGLELRGAAWQTPAYHLGEGRELLAAAAEQQLEGVVAKRLDSPYRPGKRTDEWLKIKNVNRQELVIGGWLPGKGARAGRLGALLMGYYEPDHEGRQALRYAGRVGTGFDDEELERLDRELASRPRDSSPFTGIESARRKRTELPRGARFVQPQLVAEIEFRQWTQNRILRHSVYKGLREDKPAGEVRMEMPAATDGNGAVRTSKTGGHAAEKRTKEEKKKKKKKTEENERPHQQPYEIVHETKRASEIELEGRTLKADQSREGHVPAHRVYQGRASSTTTRSSRPCCLHISPGGRSRSSATRTASRESTSTRSAAPRIGPAWVRTAAIRSERGNRDDRLLPGRRPGRR